MSQSGFDLGEASQPGGLLERERELDALNAIVRSTIESGNGRICIIEGEAGIGKTSLLAAAAEQGEALGVTVLRARGDELERGFAWGLAIQLFAKEAASDPDRVLRGPAELARPLFEQAAWPEGPPTGGFSLLHGLHWLTINLAEAGPILLELDDVHLADTESLDLVNYVRGRLHGLPIVVLLAKRSGEPAEPREAELIDRIRVGTDLLEPRPLSSAGVKSLVHRELPTADEATVRSIAESVAGNPFLCRELAAAIQQGSPGSAGDREESRRYDLRRVRDSIVVRLVDLGTEAGSLAEAVAVLGSAPVDVAAEVGGLDPESALDAASLLAGRRILTPGPELEFVHPVVREAVDESTPPPQRRDLHRRAAAALFQRGAAPERIAAHLRGNDPFDDEWAVELMRGVAATDLIRGAAGRAADSLGWALAGTHDPQVRALLLVELGKAEAAAGRPGGLERFRQALATLQGELPPTIALELGEALYASGNFADAVEAYERGLELLDADGAGNPELEARLIAGLDTAGLLGGTHPPRAAEAVAEAYRERPREPSLAARIVMAVAAGEHAMGIERPARKVEALALGALADGLAEDLGRAVLEPLTASLIFCGRYSKALEILNHHIAISSERGEAVAFASLLAIRSNCHLCLGRLGDAASDAVDVIRIADEIPGSSAMAVPIARGVLARVYVERGEETEAREATDTEVEAQPWCGSPLAGWYLEGLATVELAWGDPERAATAFLTAGETLRMTGGPASFSSWRSGAAMALLRLGHTEEAAKLAEEELKLVEELGSPRSVSISLRALAAVVGRGPEAIRLLSRAVELAGESEARLERARALVELGAALRRDGRARECREPLRAGMGEARELGADALVSLASDELDASGARRPEMSRKGADSLTPSQRRVATLAASGLSNREIAAKLFITLRTVETHLTMTYRKLSIDSRGELPEALELS